MKEEVEHSVFCFGMVGRGEGVFLWQWYGGEGVKKEWIRTDILKNMEWEVEKPHWWWSFFDNSFDGKNKCW